MLDLQLVRAAVLVNRQAGCMRRDAALLAHIRASCAGRLRLYVTEQREDLARVARALADEQVTTLGIVGGDGSVSLALTALWRVYGARPLPRIALLRGGTMNTIASSLGVANGRCPQLIERMIAALAARQPLPTRPRPALRVGDELGFLFGTGVWYGYLAHAYGAGHPTRLHNAAALGHLLASAAVGGETYRRVLPQQALSVCFDGGGWQARKYLAVAAATVAHAGFGFAPFHRAFEADDRFQLLAITSGPLGLMRDFPRLRVGRGLRPTTARSALVRAAELHAEGAEAFGYSVDGELATARASLRLAIGPTVHFVCL